MTDINVHVDTSDADDELRRLAQGPDLRHILALETVLAAQFSATQAHVHIITGSLKASGALDSDYRDQRWTGQISYGGPAPGSVHNPVRYAQIERARAPGGAMYHSRRGFLAGTDSQGRTSVMHDFLAPVGTFEPLYGQAVGAFLEGH